LVNSGKFRKTEKIFASFVFFTQVAKSSGFGVLFLGFVSKKENCLKICF
jgi:hypothetical protein